MKRILLLCLLWLALGANTQAALAQTDSLTNHSQISILSSDPGVYLFEAFGHSSMRIRDPKNNIDWVYNFGMFDFFQENFYINFVRGYMKYHLGVVPFLRVKQSYQRRRIPVRELVLNLSLSEKQEIFELLQENSKEENKYYYYDYFYDNCATRFRDILHKVLGERLLVNNPHPNEVASIRQLMKPHLTQHTWGEFGIDLALGSKIDRSASYHDFMYLPKYLEEAFDHAEVVHAGKKENLVLSNRLIINPYLPAQAKAPPIGPITVGWTVFGIGLLLSIIDWFRKKTSRWFDMPFFFVIGLVGLILLLMWFATNHITAANNYNLLWAWPLHLVFAFGLLRSKKHRVTKYYFGAVATLATLLLISWAIIPQNLHEALVPIVLLIAVRSALIFLDIRKWQLHN